MEVVSKRRSDYGKKRGKRVPLHKCIHCDYTHASNMAVKTHYLFNHASEEERKKEYKFYCDFCKFGCMSKHAYDRHKNTKKHQLIYELWYKKSNENENKDDSKKIL